MGKVRIGEKYGLMQELIGKNHTDGRKKDGFYAFICTHYTLRGHDRFGDGPIGNHTDQAGPISFDPQVRADHPDLTHGNDPVRDDPHGSCRLTCIRRNAAAL